MSEIPGLQDIYFRGIPTEFVPFRLKNLKNRDTKDGPGFYFTSEYEDACVYAERTGIVIEVRLFPQRFLSNEAKPDHTEVKELILAAEGYEAILETLDRDPEKALEKAINTACIGSSQKEAFLNIWYRFYQDKPLEYLKALIDMRYDGHISPTTITAQHIVIYNPDAIEIISIIPQA
jgi:hypothetical protein